MIKMTNYYGAYVPEEMITRNKFGEIEDCLSCGSNKDSDINCCEIDCDQCVVTKVFDEYAKLTKQTEDTNWCKDCAKSVEKDSEKNEMEVVKYSNADNMRLMSDEQLAEFLTAKPGFTHLSRKEVLHWLKIKAGEQE